MWKKLMNLFKWYFVGEMAPANFVDQSTDYIYVSAIIHAYNLCELISYGLTSW